MKFLTFPQVQELFQRPLAWNEISGSPALIVLSIHIGAVPQEQRHHRLVLALARHMQCRVVDVCAVDIGTIGQENLGTSMMAP